MVMTGRVSGYVLADAAGFSQRVTNTRDGFACRFVRSRTSGVVLPTGTAGSELQNSRVNCLYENPEIQMRYPSDGDGLHSPQETGDA